jgi:hypothetical protein
MEDGGWKTADSAQRIGPRNKKGGSTNAHRLMLLAGDKPPLILYTFFLAAFFAGFFAAFFAGFFAIPISLRGCYC